MGGDGVERDRDRGLELMGRARELARGRCDGGEREACEYLEQIEEPRGAPQSFVPTKRDHRVRIGPAELYFHVQTYEPDAPYLLYLNGGPGGVSVHGRALFEEVDLERNIIFLDQRGCGKSERVVPREAFRFESLVRDIDEVLETVGVDEVILLGHSWGGVYSIKYALARPRKVRGVIAISPVDSWEKALDRYYDVAPRYARRYLALWHKVKTAPDGLNDSEIDDLRRFCGFMRRHHEDPVLTERYDGCVNDPRSVDADEVTAELEEDLRTLEKHRSSKNRWPGWSARGIRKKYGLYDFSWKCGPICTAAKARARKLYTKQELSHGEAMEKGLWINEGWGSYDLTADLAKLERPFFYIYGRHDELFASPELRLWAVEKGGAGHAIELERSGHSPMNESPLKLKTVVREIYRELSAGSS